MAFSCKHDRRTAHTRPLCECLETNKIPSHPTSALALHAPAQNTAVLRVNTDRPSFHPHTQRGKSGPSCSALDGSCVGSPRHSAGGLFLESLRVFRQGIPAAKLYLRALRMRQPLETAHLCLGKRQSCLPVPFPRKVQISCNGRCSEPDPSTRTGRGEGCSWRHMQGGRTRRRIAAAVPAAMKGKGAMRGGEYARGQGASRGGGGWGCTARLLS